MAEIYLPRSVNAMEANYRGMHTEELQEFHKRLFHMMMCCETQYVGGYDIYFHHDHVYEELKRRKAVPEGYEWNDKP